MKKLTLLLFVIYNFGVTVNAQDNSLNFDGVDDYVDVGNNFGFEYTSTFTIEAWIKTNQSEGIHQIISKLGPNWRGWGFQIDRGIIVGYLISSYLKNDLFVQGTVNIADNKWHHVAMIYNGNGEIALYVDGISERTIINRAISGTIINSNSTFIGAFQGPNPHEFFEGNIYEIRIWSSIRSPSQILNNMLKNLSGNENTLIGYYKAEGTQGLRDYGVRNGRTGENNSPQLCNDIPPKH